MEELVKRIAITTNEISDNFDYAVEVGMRWGIKVFELKGVWDGARVPAVPDYLRRKIMKTVKDKGITISAVSPGAFITHRSNPLFECYILHQQERSVCYFFPYGKQKRQRF